MQQNPYCGTFNKPEVPSVTIPKSEVAVLIPKSEIVKILKALQTGHDAQNELCIDYTNKYGRTNRRTQVELECLNIIKSALEYVNPISIQIEEQHNNHEHIKIN